MIKKVTLSNYLKTIGPDTNICIGTLNGCGFMFFGKPIETDLIKTIFDNYRKDRVKEIQDIKTSLIYKLNNHEKVTPNDYYSLAKSISNDFTYMNRLAMYNKEYKSPLKRCVEDSYFKDIDNCLCIIIEGKEKGKFWFKSEFGKVYNKNEQR